MRKSSLLNPLMLMISVLGAAAAYISGELLLLFASNLPYWLQCGLYLLLMAGICCLTMFLSEMIHTGGYLLRHRREFKQTAGKAVLIMLPAALLLGIVTQLLYGLVGVQKNSRPNFQGTMIVCDISGSMYENDPEMEAVKAIVDYIGGVPLGEYLGVTLYNDTPQTIRKYSVLRTEQERTDLMNLISSTVAYDGGTEIQPALMDAFEQMRAIEKKEWPGLIMLFSDGLSEVDYAQLQEASLGDANSPKSSIPVNTIYYASTEEGGIQMQTIAEITGGTYFYMGIDSKEVALRDAFKYSRSIFTVKELHLLRSDSGLFRNAPVRIILQALLLSVWGIFIGVLVVVFLNNNRLIRHYLYGKIGLSVIFGILFAVLMTMDGNLERLARVALVAGMCLMFLPTYSWDNAGDGNGVHGLYSAR